MKSITIIGAGLAGSLMALYLAKLGYKVDIYEGRDDLRLSTADTGRSINLALSYRGITALSALNLMNEVQNILVPMRARAIHEVTGEINFQPFGRHKDEYINAVLRTNLNALLLDKAQEEPNINIQFNAKLIDVDFEAKKITLKIGKKEHSHQNYQILLGADGASSCLRETMKKYGYLSFTRDFLSHGYKELSISSTHGHQLIREHLHLWPRDSFLLLGNPNLDDSLTGSLFLPYRGQCSFENLINEKALLNFFKRYFADIANIVPNLVDEFFNHPTGTMSTIKCSTWYISNNCLLIGDAAHGIIPFFGQGMNCAFEDCRVLYELIGKYEHDWQKIMPAFFKKREQNTIAVAKMSMDNYHEIHHDILDKKFNLKKQVEKELMRRYPNEFITKHVLVMFTNTPYSEAYEIGEIQKNFIDEICENITSIDEIDDNLVKLKLDHYKLRLKQLNFDSLG